MIGYTNESKVKDIAESYLKADIGKLLKDVQMDNGIALSQDVFSHTVNRLAYLIQKNFKGLMLGEVRYVFEATAEHLNGKINTASILRLFHKYMEQKIEKQRREYESREQETIENFNGIQNSLLCKAIIHKVNLMDSGQLKGDSWYSMKIKDVAKKIESGEIKVMMPVKKKRKFTWED